MLRAARNVQRYSNAMALVVLFGLAESTEANRHSDIQLCTARNVESEEMARNAIEGESIDGAILISAPAKCGEYFVSRVYVELFTHDSERIAAFSPVFGTDEGGVRFGVEVSRHVQRVSILLTYGDTSCDCIVSRIFEL